MKISQEGVDITNRFFQALNELKSLDRIKGIKSFTDEHDINRWNLYTVMQNPEKSILKPEWIRYLCKDYNVSLKWIFFGIGNMFE